MPLGFFAKPVAASESSFELKLGDYILWGTYNGKPIRWRAVAEDENGMLMLSDEVLAWRAFNSRGLKPANVSVPDGYNLPAETDVSGRHRLNHGSNIWVNSTIRTWLNSNDPAGQISWLGNPPSAAHVATAADAYDQDAGFLTSFSEFELSHIKTVKLKNIMNQLELDNGWLDTVDGGGNALHSINNNLAGNVVQNYDTAFHMNVTDRIFLLDIKQVAAVHTNGVQNGWTTYTGGLSYHQGYYQPMGFVQYWLRTAQPGNNLPAQVRRTVTTSNGLGNTNAAVSQGIRPAFYIDTEGLSVSDGEGDYDKPFEFSDFGVKVTGDNQTKKYTPETDLLRITVDAGGAENVKVSYLLLDPEESYTVSNKEQFNALANATIAENKGTISVHGGAYNLYVGKNTTVWIMAEGTQGAKDVYALASYTYKNFYNTVTLRQEGKIQDTGRLLYYNLEIPGKYGVPINSYKEDTLLSAASYDTVTLADTPGNYASYWTRTDSTPNTLTLDNYDYYLQNPYIVTLEYVKDSSSWYDVTFHFLDDSGNEINVLGMSNPRNITNFVPSGGKISDSDINFEIPHAQNSVLKPHRYEVYDSAGNIQGSAVLLEGNNFDPPINGNGYSVKIYYRADKLTVTERYRTTENSTIQSSTASQIDWGTEKSFSPANINNYVCVEYQFSGSDRVPWKQGDTISATVTVNTTITYYYKDDINNNGVPDDEEVQITTNWIGVYPDGNTKIIKSESVMAVKGENITVANDEQSGNNFHIILDEGNSPAQWIFDSSRAPNSVTLDNIQSDRTVIFYYNYDSKGTGVPDVEHFVTEKYVVFDGANYTEIQGDTHRNVIQGDVYSRSAPSISGYTRYGYMIDGTFVQFVNDIRVVTFTTSKTDHIVTFVYREIAAPATVTWKGIDLHTKPTTLGTLTLSGYVGQQFNINHSTDAPVTISEIDWESNPSHATNHIITLTKTPQSYTFEYGAKFTIDVVGTSDDGKVNYSTTYPTSIFATSFDVTPETVQGYRVVAITATDSYGAPISLEGREALLQEFQTKGNILIEPSRGKGQLTFIYEPIPEPISVVVKAVERDNPSSILNETTTTDYPEEAAGTTVTIDAPVVTIAGGEAVLDDAPSKEITLKPGVNTVVFEYEIIMYSEFTLNLTGDTSTKKYTPSIDLLRATINTGQTTDIKVSYVLVDPEAVNSVSTKEQFNLLSGDRGTLTGAYTLNIGKNCTVWIMAEGKQGTKEVFAIESLTYKNFYEPVRLIQEGKIQGTNDYLYRNLSVPGLYGVPVNSYQNRVLSGVTYDNVPLANTPPIYSNHWTRISGIGSVTLNDYKYYSQNPYTISLDYTKNPDMWYDVTFEFLNGTDILIQPTQISVEGMSNYQTTYSDFFEESEPTGPSRIDVDGMTNPYTAVNLIPSGSGSLSAAGVVFELPEATGSNAGLRPHRYEVYDNGGFLQGIAVHLNGNDFDPIIGGNNWTVKVYYTPGQFKVTEHYLLDDTGGQLRASHGIWISQENQSYNSNIPYISGYVCVGYQFNGESRIDFTVFPVSNTNISRSVTADTSVTYFYKVDSDGNGIPDDYEIKVTINKIGYYSNGTTTTITSEPRTVRKNENITVTNDGGSGNPNHIIPDSHPSQWIFDSSKGGASVTINNIQKDETVNFYYNIDSLGTGTPDIEYRVTEKYQNIDGQELRPDTETSVLPNTSYSKTAPSISEYTRYGYKLDNGTLIPFVDGNRTAVINAISSPNHVVTFVYRKIAAPATVTWTGISHNTTTVTLGTLTLNGYVGQQFTIDHSADAPVAIPGEDWELEPSHPTSYTITLTETTQSYTFKYGAKFTIDVVGTSDDGKVNYSISHATSIFADDFYVTPNPVEGYRIVDITALDFAGNVIELDGRNLLEELESTDKIEIKPSKGKGRLIFIYEAIPKVVVKAVERGNPSNVLYTSTEEVRDERVGTSITVNPPNIADITNNNNVDEASLVGDNVQTIILQGGVNTVIFEYEVITYSDFTLNLAGDNSNKKYTPETDLLRATINTGQTTDIKVYYVLVNPEPGENYEVNTKADFNALIGDRGEILLHDLSYCLSVDKNTTVWIMAEGKQGTKEVFDIQYLTYKNFYEPVRLIQEGKIQGTDDYLYRDRNVLGLYGVPVNSYTDTLLYGVPYDNVPLAATPPIYSSRWMRVGSVTTDVTLNDYNYFSESPTTITLEYTKDPDMWYDVTFEFLDLEGNPIPVDVLENPYTVTNFVPSGGKISDSDIEFEIPQATDTNLKPHRYEVYNASDEIQGVAVVISENGFDPIISGDGYTIKIYYRPEKFKVTESYILDGTDQKLQDDRDVWVDNIAFPSRFRSAAIVNYVCVAYQFEDDDRQILPFNNNILKSITEDTSVTYFYMTDADNNGVPDDKEFVVTIKRIGDYPDGRTVIIENFPTDPITVQKGGSVTVTNDNNGGDDNHTIPADGDAQWIFDNKRTPNSIEIVDIQKNTEIIFYYSHDSKGIGVPDVEQYVTEKYEVFDGTNYTQMPDAPNTYTSVLLGENYSKTVPSKTGFVRYGYKIDDGALISFTDANRTVTINPTTKTNHTVTFVYREAAAYSRVIWRGTTVNNNVITLGSMTLNGYVGQEITVHHIDSATFTVDKNVWSLNNGENKVVTLSSETQTHYFEYGEIFDPDATFIINVIGESEDGVVNYSREIETTRYVTAFPVTPDEIVGYKVTSITAIDLFGEPINLEKDLFEELERTGEVVINPSKGKGYLIFTYEAAPITVIVEAFEKGNTSNVLYREVYYPEKNAGDSFTINAPDIASITGENWKLSIAEPMSKEINLELGFNRITFEYELYSDFTLALTGDNINKKYIPETDILRAIVDTGGATDVSVEFVLIDPENPVAISTEAEFETLANAASPEDVGDLHLNGGVYNLYVDKNATVWIMAKGKQGRDEVIAFESFTYKNFYEPVTLKQEGKIDTDRYLYSNLDIPGTHGVPINSYTGELLPLPDEKYETVYLAATPEAYADYWKRVDGSITSFKLDNYSYYSNSPYTVVLNYEKDPDRWYDVAFKFLDDNEEEIDVVGMVKPYIIQNFIPSGKKLSEAGIMFELPEAVDTNLRPHRYEVYSFGGVKQGDAILLEENDFDPVINGNNYTVKIYYKADQFKVTESYVLYDDTSIKLRPDHVVWVENKDNVPSKFRAPEILNYVCVGYRFENDPVISTLIMPNEIIFELIIADTSVTYFYKQDSNGNKIPDDEEVQITVKWIGDYPNGDTEVIKPDEIITWVKGNSITVTNDNSSGNDNHIIPAAGGSGAQWIFDKERSIASAREFTNIQNDITVIFYYSYDSKGIGVPDVEQYVTEKYVVFDGTNYTPMDNTPDTYTSVLLGENYSKTAPYKDGFVRYGYKIDDGDLLLFTGTNRTVTINPTTEPQHTVTFVYRMSAASTSVRWIGTTRDGNLKILGVLALSGYIGQEFTVHHDADAPFVLDQTLWMLEGDGTHEITLSEMPQNDFCFSYNEIYDPEFTISVTGKSEDGVVDYSYDIAANLSDGVIIVNPRIVDGYKVTAIEDRDSNGDNLDLDGNLYEDFKNTGKVNITLDPLRYDMNIFIEYSLILPEQKTTVTVRAIEKDNPTNVLKTNSYDDETVGESFSATAPSIAGWELDAGESAAKSIIVSDDPSENIIDFEYSRIKKTVIVLVYKNGSRDNTLTQILNVPLGTANYTINPPSIQNYTIKNYRLNGGTEVTTGLNEINIGTINDDVTVVLNYVSYVKITVNGRENSINGNILFSFTTSVQYSNSTVDVIDTDVDLPLLAMWELKAGEEAKGSLVPNADKTIDFLYSTKQTNVTVRAVMSNTGFAVPGFNPITVDAIKGEPFSYNAPYIPGYVLAPGESAVKSIESVIGGETMTFAYEVAVGNVTVLLKEDNANGMIISALSYTFSLGETQVIPVPDLRDMYFTALSTPQIITYTGVPLTVEYYYERDTILVMKKTYNASDKNNPNANPLMELNMGEYRIGDVVTFFAPSKDDHEVAGAPARRVIIRPPGQTSRSVRAIIYQEVSFYYEPISSGRLVVEALNEHGEILHSYHISGIDGESITVTAPDIEGYVLKSGEPNQKTKTIPGKIVFNYTEIPKTANLNISIVDAITGQVLPGATITISHGTRTQTYFANTFGRFSLSDAALGDYFIRVSFSGYHGVSRSVQLDGNVDIQILLNRIIVSPPPTVTPPPVTTPSPVPTSPPWSTYPPEEDYPQYYTPGPTSPPNNNNNNNNTASNNTPAPEDNSEDDNYISLEKDVHIRYIHGYGDGTVRPDAYITRAEASTIFYNLLEYRPEAGEAVFTDVDEDKWYADIINALASLNILKGYGDGTFKPENNMTRAEFMSITSNFEAMKEIDTQIFPDVGQWHWAFPYVNSAYAKGWISGYPSGEFKPDDPISRAEVVTIVNRILNRKIPLERIPDDVNPFIDLPKTHWAYAELLEASIEHDYRRDLEGYEIWENYN